MTRPERERLLQIEVEVLSPPSLIENTLTLCEVRTVADLLSLDMSRVSTMRGVGRGKVEALELLRARARALLDGGELLEEEEEAPTLLDELAAAGVNLEEPWELILKDLGQRARTVFQREGMTTLRDVVVRYESGSLTRLPGFGATTLREVGGRLDRLVSVGLEAFWYGPQGKPASLGETLERFLGELSDEDRALVERRHLHHETLEELATALGVTREGVRQRLERALSIGMRRYSDLVREHLGAVMGLLRHQGGLMSRAWALERAGEGVDEPSFLLAMALIDLPLHSPCPSLWCALDVAEYQRVEQELQRAFERCGQDMVPLSTARAWASQLGLMCSDELMAMWLIERWDTWRQRDAVFNPWLDTPALYASLLESLGRAASLSEVAQAIQARYQLDEAPSERHVYANLQRAPEVYYVDRGTYAHQAHLPMPLEQLERAAQRAIDALQGTSHAVSASIFLDALREQGLVSDAVSSLLLRDVMGRDPRIRTFQSTDFVAHLDSFKGQRKTQEDHITRILLDAGEPLSCDEVCARFPAFLTYNRNAIYMTLSQALDVINLGQGRFLHRDAIGLTRAVQERLLGAAAERLAQASCPMSSALLLEELSASAPAAAFLSALAHGPTILWAMLRQRQQVIAGRGELLLHRSASRGEEDPLIWAALELLEQRVVMTPSELRRELVARYGYAASHGPVYDALDRAERRGQVRRLFARYRVLTRHDNTIIFDALSRREDLDTLTAEQLCRDPEEAEQWLATLAGAVHQSLMP